MRLTNCWQKWVVGVLLSGGLHVSGVALADHIYGLQPGTPEIQSVSAIGFGPDGILFIGDAKSAQIFAIETGDEADGVSAPAELLNLDQQLAQATGRPAAQVRIADLAVNPESRHVFVAIEVENEAPRVFQLTSGEQALREIQLQEINFGSVKLPNAVEDREIQAGNRTRNNRSSAITDITFANGQLLVAGLSNDQSAANVWSIRFPFQSVDQGTPLEFYHGAHGRSEDYAPIRTFVPFIVNGEPSLLAGFVCTPLVRFPLKDLSDATGSAAKVRGTTLAELGNRNQPLDMITYRQGDRDYLLLSNSARGVMKISTEELGRDTGITSPIPDGNTAGQPYETIDALAGTIQLDKLDDSHAVVILRQGEGPATFKIVALP